MQDFSNVSIFFSTPELVLYLFRALNDDDLLVLAQVSANLNALAIQTFFTLHGMTLSDTSFGIFTISSFSLFAFHLALFIPPIRKLSCIFDRATFRTDMTFLQRLLSRRPPIPELTITCNDSDAYLRTSDSLSSFLFTLHPFNHFLILTTDGDFRVSKHRRLSPHNPLTLKLPSNGGICRLLTLSPAICFFIPIALLVDLVIPVTSALADPHARTRQDERIHWDLGGLHLRSESIRIITSPISPCPSWTMVTFDESIMTKLDITCIPFLNSQRWSSILSNLSLPRLQSLSIKHNVHISLSTLISFINRHPTINSLILSHYAVQASSYPPTNTTFSGISLNNLNTLQVIQASGTVIHILLKSAAATLPNNLHTINIGPKIQMARRGYYESDTYVNTHAKVETPFDFHALDRALVTILKDCKYLGHGCGGITLRVTIPGGSKAKKWLLDCNRPDLGAAGSMITDVKELNIATERGIPLSPSAILPLADWIIRVFISRVRGRRKVCLMWWVIANPNQKTVFEKRIREVAGGNNVDMDFYTSWVT